MGSQLTKNYEVERDPRSEGGIAGAWKIYSATRRDREHSPVSIFTFDKRVLDRKQDKLITLNRLKNEVSALIKLRHPNVLQVLEPMLEDKTTIAWVTEPLEYCLGDLLRRPHILSNCLGDTETRLGILDVIQGLAFIHNDARMVHFAVCPDNIYITQGGKWKIGGLSFAGSYAVDSPGKLDSEVDIIVSAKTFRYQVEIEKIAPLIYFCAPEVVSKAGGMPSCDIFSLGCSIYAIYKALSNTSSDLLLLTIEEYSAAGHRSACLNAVRPGNVALNCLPDSLGEMVIKMVSVLPNDRPGLHELSISKALQTPYVKTIYYLEHLQEKQDAQKVQFFKGLTGIIDKFDKVIMHKRLLPALVSNMQHPSLTPFILPSILTVLKSCEITKELFQQQIWPSIAKLVTGKEIPAQSFYLILNEVDLLVKNTEPEACKKCLMPLVFKGYECGVAQLQTTIMAKTPQLIKELQDSLYVKQQLLPRFLQGIINSKLTVVKEAGLKTLSQIFSMFDRNTMVETIIPSLEKFKKFDITGPMVMYLLEVYEGISKVLGHKATSVSILPSLLPLLVEAEMSKKEFERLFASMIGMMNLIREARVAELTDEKEEMVVEGLKNEDVEEVNDIFRDIFDVAGKPVMEAPAAGNNEISDIFRVEKTKGEVKPEPKGFESKGGEGKGFESKAFDIKGFDSKGFESKGFDSKGFEQPALQAKVVKNEADFHFFRPEPKSNVEIPIVENDKKKPSPVDDIFAELSGRPKEEFKANKPGGMQLKPPPPKVSVDFKPGTLKPAPKKQVAAVPINTDDFFNEFLSGNNKKDPFAGL